MSKNNIDEIIKAVERFENGEKMATADMVWKLIGKLIFNMLILVGSVKMVDRVAREMMGL